MQGWPCSVAVHGQGPVAWAFRFRQMPAVRVPAPSKLRKVLRRGSTSPSSRPCAPLPVTHRPVSETPTLSAISLPSGEPDLEASGRAPSPHPHLRLRLPRSPSPAPLLPSPHHLRYLFDYCSLITSPSPQRESKSIRDVVRYVGAADPTPGTPDAQEGLAARICEESEARGKQRGRGRGGRGAGPARALPGSRRCGGGARGRRARGRGGGRSAVNLAARGRRLARAVARSQPRGWGEARGQSRVSGTPAAPRPIGR